MTTARHDSVVVMLRELVSKVAAVGVRGDIVRSVGDMREGVCGVVIVGLSRRLVRWLRARVIHDVG